MMPARIYCCENFAPEVKTALRGECLGKAQCVTFKSHCGRPPVTWGEVRSISGGSPGILVGGECLAQLGPPPDDLSRILPLHRTHCTALICGDYSFARFVEAGSYLVTAGWLSNWRSIVDGWDFDGSTGAEFFAESCARLTLLDTGGDPGSERALREFGNFVQRPVETAPVGLELLALQLEKALADLERLDQARLAPHRASASDYALLLDMLYKISGSSGHGRVIDEMLAFFSMLFAAAEVAFIPARAGAPLRRQGSHATKDRLLRQLAEGLQEPCHVEEDQGAFMVRLSHNGLVGWLWAARFATPQHLPGYLSLAVTAANVCAMAIASARAVHRNLKESEERYRLLFENMGNGFALLEVLPGPMGTPAGFRFVEVNPAFESFIGKEAEELVGQTMAELIPGFDPAQMESLGQLAREGVPLALERYLLNGKCCQVWLFRSKPGYCGMIINDITKQKLLEDKLRQSIKMESVGRLAGGVAHDFNNMLSVIIGYAELLNLEYHDNRRIADSLREICNAAEHSRDITAQLLSFSGKQLISPKTVDLNQAIAELARKVSPMAGQGVRVLLALSDELWKVRIDPVQLEEIVFNIVRNACAAMPGGGELAMATRNVTLGEEECGGNIDAAPGDYVECSIADSGHGMDAETFKHVFEPFFTTREVGQGIGLGLATVYGMVTQNGGFVNLSSARGVGTTIRVYLPRHLDRVVAARALKAAPGSGTVLVIEDDETVGTMTARMLEHMGYQVLMAENSLRAVEICRIEGNRVDLVLSDVMLPGASGKEAVDEILAMRPGLQVIYMSGYAPEAVMEKGVDRARVNFIQKPFDMATLTEMIKSALSGGVASS